jgi:membrane protein required for colicin V production
MNAIDLIILASLALSLVTGFFWGLIRQVIALVGLVGGLTLAGQYYAGVAGFLHGSDGKGLVTDENWARIIAFVGIMILFSLILGIAGSVLRIVARLLFLGWLDRVLGAILGLLVALTLTMSMVVVATVFPVPGLSDGVRDSQVAQMFSGYIPVVLAMLPQEFHQYYDLARLGVPGLPPRP